MQDSQKRPPQWGVTPPVSLAEPSEKNKELTKSLVDELHRRGTYESAEEARLREFVLGKLDLIVKDFVKRVYVSKGQSEAVAEEAGGKIFTSGSYRLGVHGPGDDIDTLCVAPKLVDFDDFFSIFQDMLKERPEVTKLVGVHEAYVPIIKITFSGIDVDLLFSQLALSSIPNDLELRDDNLLKNLDERCVRSVGGNRVTDEMLRLVPDVHVFRIALRTIRLWAKNRAIYSNVMGFCGGVAWAIMVARICQLYPREVAGGIVTRFFIIMYRWKWPSPVVLKHIEDGPLPVRVWNPKLYASCRLHRMPIITPAYPSMCSTHNVSYSTQEVMIQELGRAAGIVDRIAVGQADWSELFKPHDFFTRYRYYIQITASSGSSDLHRKWAGLVESKVRMLILRFETNESLKVACPFVSGFHHTYVCANQDESAKLMAGESPSKEVEDRTKQYEDQETLPEGLFHCLTTHYYIGLQIEKRPKGQPGTRQLNFSDSSRDFYDTVKKSELYDSQKMSIHLRHLKSSQLPPFVFETRSAKRPKEELNGNVETTIDGEATAAEEVADDDQINSNNGNGNGNGNGNVSSGSNADNEPSSKKLRPSSSTPPLENASGDDTPTPDLTSNNNNNSNGNNDNNNNDNVQ